MSRHSACKRRVSYSNEELLHRPLEHVLEALSPDEIAFALGVSRNEARHMQRDTCRITARQEHAIRAYLGRLG